MLILNNPHAKHDITFKWKPASDYEENGSIIYARGSLNSFKGKINTEKATFNKVFAEGIVRKNSSFVIETVSQMPFRKNDIIIDDMGKIYLIVNPTSKLDENQGRFLKSAYMSKYQLLGVEGDE